MSGRQKNLIPVSILMNGSFGMTAGKTETGYQYPESGLDFITFSKNPKKISHPLNILLHLGKSLPCF
jgi:hypothetical protein